MISIENAREIILSKIQVLPSERVHLENALGRYLSQDIISSYDVPSFDNSAMDGFALRTDDIKEPGDTLKVSYILPAGASQAGPIEKGCAAKIMTGAPIPLGANAVVKKEDTTEHEGVVTINRLPLKNENIRYKGEDISKGQMVLGCGTMLSPAALGVIASLRQPMVHVYQRPVVAVLVTGEEIAELGAEYQSHKVVSSNSYTLRSLVRITGAIPLYLGIAKDNKEDLISKLAMAKKADLILTSGGVSMGDFDLVRQVMQDQGNTLDFWQVEIKPGKPLAFGSFFGIPAICLPGNPVSTMTSFYQFARPAILKMLGAKDLLLSSVRARLTESIKTSGDVPQYIRGILSREGDELRVISTGAQGSGILTSMTKGNCFIIVPKGVTSINKGSYVECEMFGGNYIF